MVGNAMDGGIADLSGGTAAGGIAGKVQARRNASRNNRYRTFIVFIDSPCLMLTSRMKSAYLVRQIKYESKKFNFKHMGH